MHFTSRVIILLIIILLLPAKHSTLAAGTARIDTPQNGETLSGIVKIKGSVAGDTFQSAELSFANDMNSSGWTLIKKIDAPIEQNELATWDTSALENGGYRLRLLVTQKDGSTQQELITGLVLKNAGKNGTAAPGSVAVPGIGLLPTPGKPARNPATVNDIDLAFSMAQGAVIAIIIFGVIGLYLAIRGLFRDR
jgi:hypothetical protein